MSGCGYGIMAFRAECGGLSDRACGLEGFECNVDP